MAGFQPFHRVIGGIANKPVEEEFRRLDELPPAGSDVTVGVIDTGIVVDKEGKPPAWFGTDHLVGDLDVGDVAVRDDGEGDASDGHGTFVAGLILSKAPTARVRVCGVLHDRSADVMTGLDDENVAAALDTLADDEHVKVVNLSFGGGAWAEAKPPKNLRKALDRFVAERPDVAIVAAAGNEHRSRKVWPAGFPGVLAVGALDGRSDWLFGTPSRAAFSNYGPWVDVFAEGVDLLGPLPRDHDLNSWSRWSGTSFAAAVVSGRIAQIAIERELHGAAALAELLTGTVTFEDLNAAGATGQWVPDDGEVPQV